MCSFLFFLVSRGGSFRGRFWVCFSHSHHCFHCITHILVSCVFIFTEFKIFSNFFFLRFVLWLLCYFEVCCLISEHFGIFPPSFCRFYLFCLRADIVWFLIFSICSGAFDGWDCSFSWWTFPVSLRRMCPPLSLAKLCVRCPVSPADWWGPVQLCLYRSSTLWQRVEGSSCSGGFPCVTLQFYQGSSRGFRERLFVLHFWGWISQGAEF